MQAYRLFGGRRNSKDVRVLYASENRSLAILELLVHLTDILPAKFVLGSISIPGDVWCEPWPVEMLSRNWDAMGSANQSETKAIGDEWVRSNRSAVLKSGRAARGTASGAGETDRGQVVRLFLRRCRRSSAE